jgi:hypothetical protein
VPFPMLDPRLAALVLGLLASPGRLADLPARAEVTVERLDVFDEPDLTSDAPSRLRRGDRVTVRDIPREGWLTIEPPPDAFCWIEQAAIEAGDTPDAARVVAPRALVRSGHPDARMPGPPRMTLVRGASVRPLDRPPLVLGVGRSRRTWLAIAPPSGEFRHIRADGVAWMPTAPPESPEPAPLADPAIRAASLPPGSRPGPAPDCAAEIASIEASHRAILAAPVDQWRLEPIRQRYQALLRNVTDSASGNAIRARLDLVERQERMARSARTIGTILERSRRRDAEVALLRRRLAQLERPSDRPYDVEGLIQPSSRQVDGQRVFALIGPDGSTVAYLDIPPGLDVRPLVARRVGVRGTIRYNENLRARLIAVRDLEPLDDDDR